MERKASAGSDDPRISVVIPCLNEERNLPYVFGRLPSGIDEVILVDGGSVDASVDTARSLWPGIVILQQTRRGKGNALACGFAAATGDIVVMIDADGSTDPAEIPAFIAALTAGADVAKGSRFLPGGGSHDITRLRRWGNWGLSTIVNVLFRTRYSDLCYGYNAFWRDALPYFDLPDIRAAAPDERTTLWGDGFEVETLINIRVAGHKLHVTEVPSVESERIHGVSNLNAFTDGFRVLTTIIQEWRRLRREPEPVRPTPATAPQPSDPPAGYVRAQTLPPGALVTPPSVAVSGDV